MKGDISRSTFNKTRHFRKVRSEQGRVSIDADWNEQVDIQSYHNITSLLDIIGYAGTSDTNAFKITGNGPTYSIGKGRYYIGGLVAENDEEIQDGEKWQRENGDLPPIEGVLPQTDPKVSFIRPTEDGYYIAFLEVWERELTALEDPEIKEPALGGQDTSTRVKTVWQVKFLYAGTDFSKILVSDAGTDNSLSSKLPPFKQLEEFVSVERARLTARAVPMERRDDTCVLPSSTKYTGLENQLYRVEIHNPGMAGTATFKVARNNATIAAKITSLESNTMIKVSSTGKDAHLGFVRGKLAEITDERRELWGLPGIMVRLTDVDASNSQITFTEIDGSFRKEDFPQDHNPKIRMWDYYQPVRVPAENDGFLEIEHGIQIKFEASETYQTEDCWLIPARSFLLDRASDSFDQSMTGDILWPRQADGHESPVPSIRSVHHVWPLALLEFKSGRFISSPNYRDFRRIFPLLTDLVSFQYVGGDGQAAGPGQMLAAPLSVGVSLGDKPLSGVSVIFRVTAGNGRLFAAQDDASIGTSGQEPLKQITDANGLAQCFFKIDDQTPNQVVEAVMLDVFGKRVHLPILFSGSLLLNSPSAGLNTRSGIVPLDIPAQSYKIIGPFTHGANELTNNTVPPAIILGQKNERGESTTNPADEKILHMKDLTDIILLNSWLGITQPALPIPSEISPLASQMGLDQVLSSDGESIPILFKPIMIDHRQFYILAINYNKKSSRILWTPWTQVERSVKIQQMAIGKNKDGRLEVFAITNGQDVVHIPQVPPSGGWASAWSPLPGIKATQISVANNQDGRLEVFIVDANGLIHHNWQGSPNSDVWNGWAQFSEFKVTQLTIGQNQDGRLHVFAIRQDEEQQVWHTAQVRPNSGWDPWSSLPSTQIKLKAKKISVANNQDGRLEVFVIGSPVRTQITKVPDKAGFEFDAPIEIWKAKPLKPPPIGPIVTGGGGGGGVVVRPTEPVITGGGGGGVVVRPRPGPIGTGGGGGGVVVRPSGTIPIRTDPIFLPNVETIALPFRPIIFEIQTDDDAIWHKWQNEPNNKDNWSEWDILSGLKASELEVARNQDGRLEVFAIQVRSLESDSSTLYHRYQLTPNARGSINWSRWVSLGGNPDQMAIIMDDDGRLEVFVLARRSRLILSSGITVDSQVVIDVLKKASIEDPEAVDKRKVNEAFSDSAIVSRWEPENAVTNIDAHKIKGLLKMKDIPGFINQSSLYRISQTDPGSTSWTGWDSLGGGNISKLAVSKNAFDQMVVFAIDTSMEPWTLTQLPNDLHVEIRWWAIPTSSMPS